MNKSLETMRSITTNRDLTPPVQREWSEVRLENQIRTDVKEMGGVAYKFTSPNRRSVPDRLIMLPDIPMFFTEVKRWGQAPTNGQLREAERILQRGQLVYFIDNLVHARAMLQAIVARNPLSPAILTPPGKKYVEFWARITERGLIL